MGDGATRSRIEDGWHPNWERARRRGKDDAGFEEIEDFNVTSNAEEKFCGSDYVDMTFDMKLQLGGERERGYRFKLSNFQTFKLQTFKLSKFEDGAKLEFDDLFKL